MKNSLLDRMVHTPRRLALVGLLVTGVMTVTLLAQPGRMLPFKGVCIGEWVFAEGVIANVSGHGTHIGQFTGQLYDNMTVVLRAPDGSELWAAIIPKVDGGGYATVTGGTGRFYNSTGQWESTWNPPEGTPTGWIETFVGEISSVGSKVE
jgi:hypothetical protein